MNEGEIMDRIASINTIPREYIDDPDFQSMMKTVRLGDAIGSEKVYVNIDFVKPGAKSTKYHAIPLVNGTQTLMNNN